jgi:ABC-type branched-subunit amino acid transport system permease subunit
MEYILHIAVLVCIYASLAVSLNLVVGQAGIMCLSHAASFGLGAYVVALCTTASWPFTVALLSTAVLCFALSMILGTVATLLKEDGLIVVTFALQMVAFSLMTNWTQVTGGVVGIPGIPRPRVMGFEANTHAEFLVLAVIVSGFVLVVSRLILVSPFGRTLKAIREDRQYTDGLGKRTSFCVCLVLAYAGAMAALAGGVYASYLSFIDPSSFSLMESVLMLAMVILGGAGSYWGPVLGAAILVILPELLSFIGIPSTAAANIRQILYGLALVACMLWRPQGLIGEYSLGREAKPK